MFRKGVWRSILAIGLAALMLFAIACGDDEEPAGGGSAATTEEAAKNCLFRATQKMRAALGDFL